MEFSRLEFSGKHVTLFNPIQLIHSYLVSSTMILQYGYMQYSIDPADRLILLGTDTPHLV